jgi:epoxyqueuosine reductase
MNPIDLAALFNLTEADFRRRFRHTPLWRPHRRGLLQSAAIVLGNQHDERAIPALKKGLQDEEPLVRAACAWALGQLQTPAAERLLANRAAIEENPAVLQEIAGNSQP